MSKDVYQYCSFLYKLTLQIFEINPKSEEVLHFYTHIFVIINVFLIRTVSFVLINFPSS